MRFWEFLFCLQSWEDFWFKTFFLWFAIHPEPPRSTAATSKTALLPTPQSTSSTAAKTIPSAQTGSMFGSSTPSPSVFRFAFRGVVLYINFCPKHAPRCCFMCVVSGEGTGFAGIPQHIYFIFISILLIPSNRSSDDDRNGKCRFPGVFLHLWDTTLISHQFHVFAQITFPPQKFHKREQWWISHKYEAMNDMKIDSKNWAFISKVSINQLSNLIDSYIWFVRLSKPN